MAQSLKLLLAAVWVLWLSLSAPSGAQIVAPDTVQDRAPCVVGLEAEIPDGAVIRGPGWVMPDGVRLGSCSPTAGYLYFAGPGSYQISYSAWWYKLVREEVTIVLADGSQKTITVITDFQEGTIDDTATIVVTGDDGPDPPDPGPDPNPEPGKKWVGLIYESSQQNQPEVVRLKVSTEWRNFLNQRGHTWHLIDKDQEVGPNTAEIVRRAVAAGIPRLVVVSSGGVELLSRPPPTENTVATCEEWIKELDGK